MPVAAQRPAQSWLNVEGYEVLASDSRTVRLAVDLLCLQFEVSAP